MSTFASETEVPVVRTQEEIRKTLTKYGASGFLFGESVGQSVVVFEMQSRRIKFVLPVPKDKNDKKSAQLERTRWRCLLLAIKAKLECASSGITTFEQEFMAHIVMPNGRTVGQEITGMIDHSYKTNKMYPLLGEAK